MRNATEAYPNDVLGGAYARSEDHGNWNWKLEMENLCIEQYDTRPLLGYKWAVSIL